MTELDRIGNFDKDYQELADKTAESYYILEEVANQIQSIMSDLEFNPAELLQIEDRIMTLTTLRKNMALHFLMSSIIWKKFNLNFQNSQAQKMIPSVWKIS